MPATPARPPDVTASHLSVADAAWAGELDADGTDQLAEPEVWDRLSQLAAVRGARLDPSSRTALFRAYRLGFAASRPVRS